MNFNELYNEKQNVSANNPIFENKIEISHEISQKIITYWKIILSNMWDRRLTDTDYKNLVTIRNDLFPKNKIQQQDVSEFLEKFISHLNSAISVENTIEKDANSTDCAKFLENSNEYSEIKKIFYSVCIDNNNKQEYFFNYIPFKTEFSDSLNEYMANKKICFLPSIFIFVIHRNNDNKKITELMKYPTYLNMQEYCVKEIKITDYNYKLYGVACHTNQPDTGGVNTTTHGHYYAYVYNDNTLKWYKYNDEIVETLTDEDIKNTKFVTPDAYMLFYRRINN
jgi:ubiquitin C-terminal hydrolase